MEESKLKIEKFIHNYLDKVANKTAAPIDYYKFTKRGLSQDEIQEILIDYVLKSNLDKVYTIGISEFFSYKNLNNLLEDNSTKEKVIKLFKKINEVYSVNEYIMKLLLYSDFNLYFFIGLESFYDFKDEFPNTKFSTILLYVSENGLWDDPKVKKFFLYFFDNPAYVSEFRQQIIERFSQMGDTLQKFLISKDFMEFVHPSHVTHWLDNKKVSDDVKKIVMEKINIFDEDLNNIVRFYINIPKEYREMIFPTDKEFYQWIGNDNQVDDVVEMLGDMFSPERVETFFNYNPNFIDKLHTEEAKVTIKYGIGGVPEEIKSRIDLPMEEMAKFDGEDIASMFYENRDGYTDWIKHYVDGDLYDKSIYWDYNPDQSTIKQYYWGYLTSENLNKIKEILKRENPDLDLTDNDAVQEAAFEDGEVGSVLHSAAADGERNGDEAELIMDIRKGIDELFGRGNWKLEDDKVFAKISLHGFNEDHIKYAFNDCGEWYIRCMFMDLAKDYRDSRSKPSLPDYRYGIQGDFDKDAFNDYIEGNL